jgi:general stress protein 26
MSETLAAVQSATFASATAATAASYSPERRLAGPQLAAYLDRRAFAVISSTRPDGRPHATVISYQRDGADFWLPTVAGSVRERNVRAHPWLSLVVTEGDRGEHVVVIVEGPAEVVTPAAVPAPVRDRARAD